MSPEALGVGLPPVAEGRVYLSESLGAPRLRLLGIRDESTLVVLAALDTAL
jgi:hypothetical protein